MSKKILVIVLIVIAAAVVIFSLTRKKQDQNTEQPNTEVKQEAQTEAKLNYVDPEKLPEKFPADFPIEAGAEVLQNYTNNGEETFQSTRRFISQKTLQQNYDFYDKYLEEGGWEILASQNKKEVKSIYAAKAGITVSATFSISATQESVVDLSFNIKK